jgi:aminoacrylate hydrolase
MAKYETQGMSMYYELLGNPGNPPVLMLAGLGGAGKSWGALPERFAEDRFVILPDHRGTGRSSRTPDGYATAQLATDFASLLEHLDVGPAHVVGSSTGGAIAQLMALDHPHAVRSLTMASSFARMDGFMQREFSLRRTLLAEDDPRTIYDCYALFLFSPRYTKQNPERVAAWIENAASAPVEREIALKRIDMIMAHNVLARLGDIRQPTLVICGDNDFCTPLPQSEEIAQAIAGSQLIVLPGGGHLIHFEQEDLFSGYVRYFISAN